MGARRKGGILVALLLGSVAALLPAESGSAEGPTIEAAGPGSSGYFWRPSTASIGLGGTVTFKSTSPTVPHAVRWTGGPEKPSCVGVPSEGEPTNWSGDCTFAQAGIYSFVCNVHPTEMKGAITVGTTEAPAGAPPPSGAPPESPLLGPASSALKLAKSQHGTAVRGSIALSQASAGGKLDVLLRAKSGGGRVGRLTRLYLKPGRLSFTVPLKPRARRMLRATKKLPLTVQIVVTPPGRGALTLKKGVVLHV